MIKSVGNNQQKLINDILTLHNNCQSIEFDPCYNVGGFYKNGIVVGPRVKSDINPQCPGVLKLDVRNLPFKTSTFKSVIFDPPFLVAGGNSTSKMAQRYGSFNTLAELQEFYAQSLISLQRVLKHGGLLIFKFQDFVKGRQQHLILPYIYSKAREFKLCLQRFIYTGCQ